MAEAESGTRKAEVDRLFWVCVGGAVGSGARYLISGWVAQALGTAFPYGTLLVNLIGSFALASLMHVGLATDLVPPTLRIALATGVLGGFTTYSTFSYETFRYLQEGAIWMASLNVAVTVVACLAGCVLGFALARAAVGG